MLFCLVLMLTAGLADLPSLATEVEAEARTLTAQTEVTPTFLARIDEFSGDAERLSVALSEAGVEQDLPVIFQGIAADARARAAEFRAAETRAEREAAFVNLRILLDDAILIAPMAASAAADRAEAQTVAQR